MENDKRNTQCFLWCKGLTISMSKKEMAGLLETLVERNLTLIGFTEKNDKMTAVDRVKRVQELSSQAVEASNILEQITSESARTIRQQLPEGFLKTEPLPRDSLVKIDTTTFDRPCIKTVIRVPELGVAYAENVFIEDQDLAKLSDRWQKVNEAENHNAHA
jgi:hypothetical protein